MKPAKEDGLVMRGEAGDSNSHCQVVIFRGTVKLTGVGFYSSSWAINEMEDLRLISGWLLLNGILMNSGLKLCT